MYPFGHLFARNWSVLLFLVLVLSIVFIIEKENFDATYSVNDIVADVLGFFFGTVTVVRKLSNKVSHYKKINRNRFSLLSAIKLLEKLERRSSVLYGKHARVSKNDQACDLFGRLSRDSMRRAHKMRFRISGWRSNQSDGEDMPAMQKIFRIHSAFEKLVPISDSLKGAVQVALAIEQKKESICRQMKSEFEDGWKIKEIENLLKVTSERVLWLEQMQGKSSSEPKAKIGA